MRIGHCFTLLPSAVEKCVPSTPEWQKVSYGTTDMTGSCSLCPTLSSHALPQRAGLVDRPSVISPFNDTPLSVPFSMPRSCTLTRFLRVSSFLKLQAAKKVEKLLNFRYCVAVLALEGFLPGTVSFSSMVLIRQASTRMEHLSIYLTATQTCPDETWCAWIRHVCTAQTLRLALELPIIWWWQTTGPGFQSVDF